MNTPSKKDNTPKHSVCFISWRLVLTLILSCSLFGCATSSQQHVIGAGHKSGYYYTAANSICGILNKNQATNEFYCKTKVTSGGSAPNISGVNAGTFEFGIAQSDIALDAYNGTGKWQNMGSQKDLRVVMSLYSEMLTLLAADDSGINNLHDLKGKKVNIGMRGSGHQALAILAMNSAGIDWKNEIDFIEEKASDGPKLLQNKSVDAFFYVLAHPSKKVLNATSGKRKTHFVSIEAGKINKEYPYYAKANIPISWYPKSTNKSDVPTFGVKALLITNQHVSEETVYTIAKLLAENIEKFKNKHPALKYYSRQQMVEALSLPIHPGALKYYFENNLILE